MTEITDIHHYPPSAESNHLTICWREGERHFEMPKFGVEAAVIMDHLNKCPDNETACLVLRGAIEDWRAENG